MSSNGIEFRQTQDESATFDANDGIETMQFLPLTAPFVQSKVNTEEAVSSLSIPGVSQTDMLEQSTATKRHTCITPTERSSTTGKPYKEDIVGQDYTKIAKPSINQTTITNTITKDPPILLRLTPDLPIRSTVNSETSPTMQNSPTNGPGKITSGAGHEKHTKLEKHVLDKAANTHDAGIKPDLLKAKMFGKVANNIKLMNELSVRMGQAGLRYDVEFLDVVKDKLENLLKDRGMC